MGVPSAPKDRNHNRSNYMAWGMFQLPGKPKEISVYATENYYEPTPGRVRRFVYRVDGFVALRGGADGGQVTTHPLRYAGKRLLLNYVVNAGGALSIEALDKSGNIVGRSKSLRGEAVDGAVSWQQDPGFSQGVIQLRFTLKNADVFSLRELDGLSSDEICKALDLSESNVWVILHRARLRLSHCMKSHGQEKSQCQIC